MAIWVLLGYWPVPFLSPVLEHTLLCWQSRHPGSRAASYTPQSRHQCSSPLTGCKKASDVPFLRQDTKALANRIVPYVSECTCQGRLAQRLLTMQCHHVPSSSWTASCPCPILWCFTCQHHKQPSQYHLLGWQPCPGSTTECWAQLWQWIRHCQEAGFGAIPRTNKQGLPLIFTEIQAPACTRASSHLQRWGGELARGWGSAVPPWASRLP